MRARGKIHGAVLALIPLVVIAMVAAMMLRGSGHAPSELSMEAANRANAEAALAAALAEMKIPEFQAKDQEGRPFTRASMLGHWTIVNFIFTHCTSICPITTGQMVRVQEAVKAMGRSGVELLSISVDPERDTPEALKDYAKDFADFSSWTLITMDAKALRELVVGGLGFVLEEDDDPAQKIDLGEGRSMKNIRHTGKLLLIDPEGRAVGMWSGTDEADVTRLIGEVIRRVR